MSRHNPRVDAYIVNSAAFAKPILEHLRALVHEVCPDVDESIKWGFPHFGYRDAMMCSIAAFKQHCAFSFWLHEQVLEQARKDAMGQFGRIGNLADLPSDRNIKSCIRKAMTLNERGEKRPRRKASKRPPPRVPEDFAARLKRNAPARRTFEGFSPSAQREYVEWIEEAKTAATREKRIATSIEWLTEGKPRNWKYMKT